MMAIALGMFLAGLLGALHCVGMCGGVFTALLASERKGHLWRRRLALHAGRVLSYGMLGFVVGSLGELTGMVTYWAPIQIVAYALANLLMLAVGCYLLGWTKPLAPVERMGGRLWRFISPALRPLIPVRNVGQALMVGLLWGFMPCALVYGALAMALLSSNATAGAMLMMIFGLGTLPNLLAAGAFIRYLRAQRSSRVWNRITGVAVGAFGLYGLAHAAQLDAHIRKGWLCIVG